MKVLALLATLVGAASAFAQIQDNQQKQLTCDHGGYHDRQSRFCELREQYLGALPKLDVDSGKNGGLSIRGWSNNSILVRTRVEAWASSDTAATEIARQVRIDISGDQIRPIGPEHIDESGWSVSFEVFVPQNTSLTLQTLNGGISVSDVRGDLRFQAQNGGITLKRVAGSISGATVNGGIHLELAGNTWDGDQVEVRTTNGGVTVAIPQNYSAHIQAATVNGAIQSDFPITIHGDIRPANLDFNLGSGGPLIHITTTNGSVKLQQG
jgi:DUF4097 and DUF4098 domain-containing protein YvlB